MHQFSRAGTSHSDALLDFRVKHLPTPKWRKPRPLAEVLAYRNDEVVFRFQKLFRLSFREASALFTEVRRWLWALARARVDKDAPRLAVYAHMFFMDEMWHNFALFTKEYHLFCETFLGGYIHHLPMTRAAQERLKAKHKKNPTATANRMEREKLEQCNFIYHELGEKTLKKWYSEFPKRYTPDFVNSRRRPLGHAGT